MDRNERADLIASQIALAAKDQRADHVWIGRGIDSGNRTVHAMYRDGAFKHDGEARAAADEIVAIAHADRFIYGQPATRWSRDGSVEIQITILP